MILQCDQCNTKFRLDDSKLKPGGVKVRCSKCRHVFLAGAEPKQEESEFDAILSGLGAPAPEKGPADAPRRAESGATGFDFDEEAATPPAGTVPPAPATPAAPAAASTAATAAAAPAAATATAPAHPEADAFASAPAGPFDADQAPGTVAPEPDIAGFADFDFPAEPLVSPTQTSPAADKVPNFSAFDLPSEPPPLPPVTTGAPALEYGEFSFDEEPAPLREDAAPASADAFEFGDFSFPAEPEPSQEKGAPPPLDFGELDLEAAPAVPRQAPTANIDDLDYGDFSFAAEPEAGALETPAAPAEVKTPAATEDAFDFSAFSFSEEPVVPHEEPETDSGQGLDFGEFSFAEEPAPQHQAPAAAAGQGLDFGDLSFSEEPAQLQEESAPVAKSEFDFGDFSFSDEPVAPKEKPAPAAEAVQGELQQAEKAPGAPQTAGEFDFDDFSFASDLPAKPAAAAPAPETPLSAAVAPESGRHEPSPAPSHAADAAPLPPGGEAAFDFGYGATQGPSRAPEPFELDEDALPPLSIASRRKGRSVLTVSIIAISILVIVALSGAGLYLLQSGPAAFDKLGLGFVATWFGMESAEEGRITLKNQQASFVQNKEAGELFVVTGEAVNSFRKARASIHVKVSLFDKKGAVLLQKTAYCGNRLSPEQLATLPMAKIESIMNNQFGDSLSNLGVQPGKAIGFVVAIPNVPKEAADFGVEVVGSTVAGK